jgi:hypothetical protein
MMKMLVSAWIICFRYPPAMDKLVPRACVWVAIWPIVARWIAESRRACVTLSTDIHSKTLALGKNDDSLERAGDIKGEMLMVCLDFYFYPFLLYCSCLG